MSNENNDFYIQDGVLKKYLGSESFVLIPEGVRKIGDYVFACREVERLQVLEQRRYAHVVVAVVYDREIGVVYGRRERPHHGDGSGVQPLVDDAARDALVDGPVDGIERLAHAAPPLSCATPVYASGG